MSKRYESAPSQVLEIGDTVVFTVGGKVYVYTVMRHHLSLPSAGNSKVFTLVGVPDDESARMEFCSQHGDEQFINGVWPECDNMYAQTKVVCELFRLCEEKNQATSGGTATTLQKASTNTMSYTLHRRGMKVTRAVQAVLVADTLAKNPGSTFRGIVDRMKQRGIDSKFIPSLSSVAEDIEAGKRMCDTPGGVMIGMALECATVYVDPTTPSMIGTVIHIGLSLYDRLVWGRDQIAQHCAATQSIPLLQDIETLAARPAAVDLHKIPHTNGVVVYGDGAATNMGLCKTIRSKGRTITVPIANDEIPNSPAPFPNSPAPFPVPVPTPVTQGDTTVSNDPIKDFQNALATLQEVPVLKKQIADSSAAITARDQTIDHLRADITQHIKTNGNQLQLLDTMKAAIADLEARPMTANTGPVVLPNGKKNDLQIIADALRITLAQLDSELLAFATACNSPMANAVRWADWCNPNKLDSKLPFLYRHNLPSFLAGESGTGKTFLAEALCQHYAKRRCCISFHEKLSYAKMIFRETVANGVVRGVLGPVIMCLLTGTPLIADEIDHSDVFIQSLLHGVLDKQYIEIAELGLIIYAEDGYRTIATGNSLCDDSGQYHGEVGTALKTRFCGIDVSYPTEVDEAATVKTATGCAQADADAIAKVFKALRGAVHEQKLTGPISVREACTCGKAIRLALTDGMTPEQAYRLGFSGSIIEKRPRGEQQVAAEIIANLTGAKTTDFLAAMKFIVAHRPEQKKVSLVSKARRLARMIMSFE